MKMVYAILVLLSFPAFSEAPKCVNVGTRSEGWMIEGQLRYAQCANEVVYCGAKGSKSEGWYASPVSDSRLLGYDNCAQDQSRKPKCVNVGTRSEGWQTPNGQLHWDKCSQKFLKCGAQGTRSEGWYVVTADLNKRSLVTWAQCADEE